MGFELACEVKEPNVINPSRKLVRSRRRALARRMSFFLIALACLPSIVAAKEKAYQPPRLPDGHVDMQGMWKNSNLTPLQRPDQFTKPTMTAQEATTLRAQYVDGMSGQKMPDDPGGLLEERQIEPIRGELRTSIIIDPPDGKIPFNETYKDLSAKLRASALTAFDGPEQRPSLERCLASTNAPPMQPTPDNNYYQIVQTPHDVMIASELIHDARIIRMNAIHAPAAITSWLGDSIGWWEGDTLVVETKSFAENSAARLGGRVVIFASTQTTVVEHFTRVSADELIYNFTVDDPSYYTRPWTGETHLLRSHDQMFEFSCHEGNYALRNILEAARARDATAHGK
jgi:hypothetical protein